MKIMCRKRKDILSIRCILPIFRIFQELIIPLILLKTKHSSKKMKSSKGKERILISNSITMSSMEVTCKSAREKMQVSETLDLSLRYHPDLEATRKDTENVMRTELPPRSVWKQETNLYTNLVSRLLELFNMESKFTENLFAFKASRMYKSLFCELPIYPFKVQFVLAILLLFPVVHI